MTNLSTYFPLENTVQGVLYNMTTLTTSALVRLLRITVHQLLEGQSFAQMLSNDSLILMLELILKRYETPLSQQQRVLSTHDGLRAVFVVRRLSQFYFDSFWRQSRREELSQLVPSYFFLFT